jgi:nitrogen-specific signal transduction histidine kinase
MNQHAIELLGTRVLDTRHVLTRLIFDAAHRLWSVLKRMLVTRPARISARSGPDLAGAFGYLTSRA